MKSFIPVLLLILTCLTGCKKTESNSTDNKEELPLTIEAGFMCCWGTGEDSLFISNTIIRYVYYVPANSMLPKIKKARPTTDIEWANILNSLNLNNFVKLEYNSCNICVDGCDEWIMIQDDHISHQIRFGRGLKIDSISDLQSILAQFRTEFNK